MTTRPLHRPIAIMRRAVSCLAILAGFAAAPVHGDESCVLAPAEIARAVGALDGETLILADGRELRLIGAKPVPPLSERRDHEAEEGHSPRRSLADDARAALDAMAAGQSLELRFGGEREDRHGRVLAHAYVVRGEERVWLQGALIEQGHARAYSFADNHACMKDLLAREERARERKIGLWRTGAFRIRAADDTDDLLRLRQTFQIVEGVVVAFGKTRGRLFLNFGADWRTDFTVSITPGRVKRLKAEGLDVAALEGARIRVRGWIEPRSGPSIDVTHAAEIEVLAPAPNKKPAAEGPPVSQDIKFSR